MKVVRGTRTKWFGGGFLDPENVGSSVRFNVSKTGRKLRGSVAITDCDRAITWYGDYKGPELHNLRLKCAAAIKILGDAIDAIDEAVKSRKKK